MTEREKCINALGGIVLDFARLEHVFKNSIHFVSEVPVEKCLVMLARLSYTHVVDLFGDFVLVKFRDDKEGTKEVNELLKVARDANDLRNDLMHSYWFDNPMNPAKPFFKYKMRKKLKGIYTGQMLDFSLSDIKAVSTAITKAYRHLVSFMRKHYVPNFH